MSETFEDMLQPLEGFLPRVGAGDGFLVAVANAIAAQGATISLHHSDPGQSAATAQATEISGGNYARQTTTWGGATVEKTPGHPDEGKAVVVGAAKAFYIPAGVTLAYFGVWNGGTFLYAKPIDPPVPFPGNGMANITPRFVFGQV